MNRMITAEDTARIATIIKDILANHVKQEDTLFRLYWTLLKERDKSVPYQGKMAPHRVLTFTEWKAWTLAQWGGKPFYVPYEDRSRMLKED